MGGLGWNLDELVGKVMADLRGDRVDDSAARLSAALSNDFKAVQTSRSSAVSSSKVENSEVSEKKAENASCGCAERSDAASTPGDSAFYVAEKLLVAETVRRLAASTNEKRWSVRSDLIATPAAKDELRKLGVELVVDGVLTDGVSASGQPRVTYSASNVFDDEPIRPVATRFSAEKNAPTSANGARRLFWALHLSDGERFPTFVENCPFCETAFAQSRLSCLKETTKRIAAEIAQNGETRTVLTTKNAAIASIWANRLSGVRAVVAFSFEQAKRDVESANANVLIVDPSDVGPYPFRRIVEFFATRPAKER
ncbi:MAG: RpiB/LacA/LacB family sugar-phosphate isomerase [Thermoguttaceae bacterium]|nr:RpiB/LacA/LacB family sugar-phosphate isomerase [Thermoguttaceae bacterium]